MSDLSLGLTFGLAAAGALAGAAYCAYSKIRTGINLGGIPAKTLSPKYNFAAAIIGGAVLGGVAGFGVSKGVEWYNQPSCAQKDGISITMKDSSGKKTCMSLGPNGLIVVPN
jgi:hypothetical protein